MAGDGAVLHEHDQRLRRAAAGEITREELLYCAAFDDEMFTGIITGAQLHALLEAVYEPERFGNNAAIAFSGFHAASRPHPPRRAEGSLCHAAGRYAHCAGRAPQRHGQRLYGLRRQ